MTEKSKELLKFNAEVSKVLQLMIHSLYTNKGIFLRELVSNASDACDKLRHMAITKPELTKDDPDFKINILINKEAKTITISDNGVGMSRDELIENLGTIAKSGTQEFVAKLTGDNKKDMPLIGQFGVGFYSSFMVANKVSVISQAAGSEQAWSWESEGTGEFSIESVEAKGRGTSITLHIKPEEEEYLDKFRLRHIIQTYSDHIAFPILIAEGEEEAETANSASALWTRSKSDITEEQYKEFYHHIAHSPDEPWLTLHNKAEGKLEYTSLLFVPGMKPFDMFHPDRKRRVKLYVKRVFITDENVDLVPAYMRFMRGIVDSEDLPLNISRESLQNNPILTKIRDSLVSRVLSELKKKAANDETSYLDFWNNFGAVLKEGLCEAATPREQLLEVCRFHSSNSEEGMASLDSYIERMKPDQEEIYYLTGEKLDSLRASPQIEGFVNRGIEVLLLTDHVDDFWVNVVTDYKGKKLKSVTRADIKLDELSGDKKDEAKPEEQTDDAQSKALCERIKAILGDKVQDVRTTDKLTSSAVCLAVEEGAMDMRLERFLLEQKQLENATAKILEVNPNHAIIRALGDREDIDDVVWLLFDQARILEGEDIVDPAEFTRRLQSFMEKGLAA
ncbi:MAG: molecular chaperone HtpG [Rickettsiales bacterium]